jgi:hypothetical protein
VRRLVAWTVFDQVTGNTIRQLVYLPLMPPVPSGTFVRKREESLVLVEFTPEADAELRMMAHARAAQDQDAAKIILEGKP